MSENGFIDNLLIIIISDHGQLLGEYDRLGHGIFLYEELLDVPLFIKFPANLKICYKEHEDEYISLTKLKPLIIKMIYNMRSGSLFKDDILYSETVYSESYGIYLTRFAIGSQDKVNSLERFRIKIYHKEHYGVFNVHKWTFEEADVSQDSKIMDILRSKIKHYLKFNLSLKIV